MTDHPKMETLELLLQGKLRGAEKLKILRHVETCDYCFKSFPPKDPAEVVDRLLKLDDEDFDEIIENGEKDEH